MSKSELLSAFNNHLTELVEALIDSADETSEVVPFINRLSDYFFVAGRQLNHRFGEGDKKWTKNG